ncbi:nuclear transport factor 2 family protein [Archangium violaceum]|uniref:nuclear transport factor 2 family protein n=1 Tax=Archangium violaceum TaxID=83451 RepID=UPI0019526533|nr:nuclear transport factor 2 family protein [Archangium violaceum]QRN97628.1 nuclear transport factor 2 family protein [Archangium violaceum]
MRMSHQEDALQNPHIRLFVSGYQALLKGDFEGFADMWAEDGSMEFPYSPEGLPQRLDGKAAIREHLRRFPEMLHIDRFSEPVFHPSQDGRVLIAEFSCEGRAVATGKPYNQKYISVVEFRDGRIVKYRDYWNPLIALRALDPKEG